MTMVKSASRRRGRRAVQTRGNVESWDPAEDWKAIAVGTTVEVGLAPGHSYLGHVDAKTPDSSIVWVISSSGLGRQMYGNRDGVRKEPAAGRKA
jgi:hypothetical protein